MCHSIKLYEIVHDNRLRNIMSISEEQFRFVINLKLNVQLGNKLVCINSITLYLCYHVKKTDFDTIFFLECELL